MQNVFRMVRFHSVTLLSFDFPLNFLKFVLALCCVFFSGFGMPTRVKRVLAFPQIFRFDTHRCIKLLGSKYENVSPK